MYVSCERCGTEYEFDDALVSNRGTSVKCTQCGHEFRVFRGMHSDAPERWRIRVQDGTVYEYRELRELQRAIGKGLITPDDVLLREGLAPRAMGMIPELESFFANAGFGPRNVPPVASITPSTTPMPPPAMPTPLGIDQKAPILPSRRAPGTIPYGVAVPGGVSPPVRSSSIPPPVSVAPPVAAPTSEPLQVSIREVHETEEPTRKKPVTIPPRSIVPESTMTPTPSIAVYGDETSGDRLSELPRLSQESVMPEPYSVASYRGSRGGLRWVVAIVAVGAIAVTGTAIWKGAASSSKNAATERQDARVYDLVVAGEQALADGDLDEASERFSKASAIAESDVRVLLGMSRLAAIRADIAWLRLRLIPDSASEVRTIAGAELAEASARARRAAERANEHGPDDPAVLRVRVDALRLLGERSAARALAPRLAAQGSTPEAAYVLAALELAEEKPVFGTVIDRLRIAAAAEKTPGRARAALVYALARSGDAAGAKIELDRIASAARPYPLLADLRAFTQGDAARGAPTAAASASASAAPVATGTPTTPTIAATALPSIPVAADGPRNETREAPSKPGEFSEEELHRALGGAAPPKAADSPKNDTPDPPKADKPSPKPDPSPHIDTSDLPGVKVP